MKGITTTFFNIPTHRRNVKEGDILVAEPFMNDKWFGRSVITIIDHSDRKGTTGVVMNNELATTLSEVFSDIETQGVPVYCGGPLGHDRLFFLHSLGDTIIPGAREIAPGLWLGGKFASAVEYINSGYPHPGTMRFFIGYSGWSAGQLDDELKENTWAMPSRHFSPSTLLTGHGDKYWHKIVGQMDRRYRPWRVLPQDARAN